MKKLIVLLLALAMVGAVSAQAAAPALTFGAYADLTATLYDSTSTTGAFGVYTETYFNYKAKDMAFSATTVAGYDIFAAVRNYSLTYTLVPDLGLQLKAGKLRETGGARLTSYIDGNGFSTRIANVEEGVEVLASASGFGVALFSPLGTNGYKVAAGVSYAVPNVVTVVGSYRMVNSELGVGVDLKAVKGLTAKVAFKNVGTTNMIYATLGSSSLVKGVDLGLDANYNLTTSKFGAKVKAEYAMAPYALGVKASFDNGDAWYAVNGFAANPYLKWNFAAGDFILGVTYNAVTGKFTLPLDCELSF